MLSLKHDKSGAIICDSHISYAIERGNSFFISLTTNDLKNNPLVLTFTAPSGDTTMHLSATMEAAGEAYSLSVVDPLSITGGNSIVPVNRNQTVPRTSCATDIKSGATVVGGTTVNSSYFGLGKRAVGGVESFNKWILGGGRTYAITLTSDVVVSATIQVDWIECPCEEEC